MNTFENKTDILYPRKNIEFKQITSNSYNGQLDLLIEDIKSRKENGYRTLILAGTRTRGERLVKTLRDRDVESVYKDDVDSIELGQVVVTFGNLVKGFEYLVKLRNLFLKKAVRKRALEKLLALQN